jgi:hypothetical protein
MQIVLIIVQLLKLPKVGYGQNLRRNRTNFFMSVKNLDNTHKQHGNSIETMAPIHRPKPITMAESSAHILASIHPSPTAGDPLVAR